MTPPVSAGEILAGKYRIERVLGEGGMGIVVAATHLQLEQLVAIKFLLAEALQSAEIVARFAREARTLAKLQSEHVGRVIDVGVTDAGAPYMVMEYLDGRDLDGEIQARGPLPIEEAVDYLLQACEAIAEAHAAGIVHRDLKPANLFLARRATGGTTVKVLDFGISKSKSKDRRDAGLTKTTALMGSPLYMSPEQLARTRDVDARSDIWALGVILYELVSGKLPFDGDTIAELVTSVLHTPPAALHLVRADAPAELASIIDRCLQKEPEYRFADVAELARALLPLASTRGARSIERIEEALQKEPPVVEVMPRISIAAPGAGSQPKVAVLAATASTFSADENAPAGSRTGSVSVASRGTNGKVIIGSVAAAAFILGVALVAVKPRKDSPAKDVTAASAQSSGSSSAAIDSSNDQKIKATDALDSAPPLNVAPAASDSAPVLGAPPSNPVAATSATPSSTTKPASSHGHSPQAPTAVPAVPQSQPAASSKPNQPWNVQLK